MLISLALLVPCSGEELTLEILKEGLVTDLAAFDQVSMDSGEKAATLSIKLGEKPVKLREDVFDGFRFRCPELKEGMDFVWYFNAPAAWGNWYIIPVEGKPGQAFKGWMDGDKLYTGLDEAGEKDRLRILQTLDGDYFKAGSEYIIWFRRTGGDDAGVVRGTARFAKSEHEDGDWDHDAVEEALDLKEAPPEDQVAALASKGGLILLDKEFFDPGYAAGRIDSMFSSIRTTKRMSGGYFITMQVSVPPCTTRPPLDAILKKYGAPDFTRTGEEEEKKIIHAGGDPMDEDDKGITRHYYDHFALETESGATEPKVLRVTTLGSNFSVLRPPADGASVASIDIENLTVFHKDGKEVGRAYYFMEGGKKPLFIIVPPTGEYRLAADQTLIAKGKGEWMQESRFPDGKIARRIPFKRDRMHGKVEGFHENGGRKFVADYREGQLDGELVQFDKNGKETSRRKFKEGEQVEE